jgi:hypothetical protein
MLCGVFWNDGSPRLSGQREPGSGEAKEMVQNQIKNSLFTCHILPFG